MASRWGTIAAQRTAEGVDAQQLDFADMERVAAALVEGLAVVMLTARVQYRTVATVPPCHQCGTVATVD
ncbi:hypothetical protein GobsT_56030 [Gemmata obscuriglobus]|uniref:hypothetical protein n=1 Tax=Gemmata obscuriglobus TaxID=114 RepID=UPI0011CD28F8|nr:hypothetical protein [Gemmata obscuriglobus]QEG30791.1 hypothetical protein GobsT_56030 [Gemmata obscuriglobus]VTS10122.1 unnamed protein product [Gemmata obscuriglobus UQM 2246]